MIVESIANAPAYQPRRARARGHVESWFIRLNSPEGNRALWLRWTLSAAPGEPVRAESWAIAFERGRPPRATKLSEPLGPGMLLRDPFAVEFPWGRFDGSHATGSLQFAPAPDRSGDLAWDFTLAPRVPVLRTLPYEWMYRSPLLPSALLSPVPDADVTGSLVLDGERIDLRGWRASQGHNWGHRQPHRYAWAQATGFEGADDVAFEAISARIVRGGIELPWLTIAHVWIDGRWLRFDSTNAIRTAHVELSVMRWTFRTHAREWTLSGTASAPAIETAGLHYANPGAALTYCLNSKLASLELVLEGPRATRRLTTRCAAFEIGWPSADHGVVMRA